jgi:predicted nuclease of predicted toxin-antitoxin system
VYILLDENLLSKKLKQPLQKAGHSVCNVEDMGWRGTLDRELLRLAQANGFDVFITADKNLPYQQNLRNLTLKIVVLDAQSTRPSYLLPLIDRVCELLSSLTLAAITVVNDAGEAIVFSDLDQT